MPKFLVQYTHVEETTYEQWVEADSEEEALLKIEFEDEADFENEVDIQGIEIKDIEVIERVDDWWILKKQRVI